MKERVEKVRAALEEKEAVAKDVNGREEAVTVIAGALANYVDRFCK